MQELKINEEFENLIRPLTDEEFKVLEDNLKNNGCRDPITVLEDNTIIDGHNRYKICRNHNIEYRTFTQEGLDTEADIKLWMLYNQIGKRNYNNFDKSLVAIEIEKLEQVKAKERQGTRNDLKEDNIPLDLVQSKNESDISETNQSNIRSELTESNAAGKSLEKAAKAVGVGYGTVYKTKQILAKAPEEVIEKVRKGDVSVDRAYQKIQRAERLEKNQATEWPEGKYRVIYADPPWKYGDERSGGSYGGAIDHYPTMSKEELLNLPVKDLADDDAVLFIWATSPLFQDSFDILESWGFKYKTQFIWDKVKHNMGYYNSVRHEHLLIATKGSCTPDNKKLFDSVQTIERTDKHSEKPEEFRKIIETLYTYGNKVELFARTAPEGWVAYGNEIYKQKKSKPEESAENEPTKEVA